MKVKEIIESWLKEHGYDGLYDPGECGCKLGDIAPCDSESVLNCVPGYLLPGQPASGFNFMIGCRAAKTEETHEQPTTVNSARSQKGAG